VLGVKVEEREAEQVAKQGQGQELVLIRIEMMEVRLILRMRKGGKVM